MFFTLRRLVIVNKQLTGLILLCKVFETSCQSSKCLLVLPCQWLERNRQYKFHASLDFPYPLDQRGKGERKLKFWYLNYIELWVIDFIIMSSCPHVLMSPCPHVLMSPCPHVPMSPCPHVPMSPCPHVLMSSCPHVLMSPCPHLPMSSCPHVPMSHDMITEDRSSIKPMLVSVPIPTYGRRAAVHDDSQSFTGIRHAKIPAL